MAIRNYIVITFLILFVFRSQGQTQQNNSPVTKQTEKQVENPIYRLFPTENYWTFIKLDTRNGKMWQVHFTITEGEFEGELILNSDSLVLTTEEVNGRFTLYPTKNMYNFILLDQMDGRTYQVQWNSDKEKRFVSRIY
ncbi:hypothetical protein HYN48_13620 [Flavobacterium magnum]|uniref:Uncharacterized protein n=1 Tax=Flavobacterium magnum TaxID=2162713 RepID=A0A2S0RGI0_9FLAO|nr:hypothetical protein [Flavobacterium magnum]AWA31037.1 hypothetical protein HYN48_13620 [Flavobacterium magnum]